MTKNLDKAISTRDISEKKLKNSATLDIEMKKFKGYGSEDDYYTFKSEFKKLVPSSRFRLPTYLLGNFILNLAKSWNQLRMKTIYEIY